MCSDFSLLSKCLVLNDSGIRASFVSAISRSNMSVIRNKLNLTSLKASQIWSVRPEISFFCLTCLHVLSLSGFSLSLRGLFSFVPSINLSAGLSLPLRLFLLNSQSLYSDESVFHYLLRCLCHPRRSLQHIEARVCTSAVHRGNRGGCTRCQQRRAERGRLLIYSFFIEGVPVCLLSHQKNKRKKRVCTT